VNSALPPFPPSAETTPRLVMTENAEVFRPVLYPALELIENLLIRRKVPSFQLRVDELSVQRHFKTTTLPWNELERAEPILECIHDRLRQAHGLWDVVSSDAILDADFHVVLCHPEYPPVMGRC
jgi:hypothetical protein